MKLTFAILAVLGLATASAIPATRTTRNLKSHWDDFRAMIDDDAVIEIIIMYLAEDAEVNAALEYAMSDGFKNLVHTVDQTPEWQALLNHLSDGGLDVWTYRNHLFDFLDGNLFSVYSRALVNNRSARITGGIKGLWADLKAVLPLDDLKALFHHKVANDADFAHLITIATSDEAKSCYAALAANSEWQNVREELAAVNVDVDYVIDFVKAAIGWQ